MSFTNLKVFQNNSEIIQRVESLKFDDLSVTDIGSGTATVAPIFGANFQFVEDLSQTTTTSTDLQQKLRLTTTDLPGGLYRIGWSYRFAAEDRLTFKGRVQLNDNIDLKLHFENTSRDADFIKDSLPSGQTMTGFAYYSLSGVNDIDVDFATDKASKTSGIAAVRIELWQVGTDTTYLPGSEPGTL